MGPRDRRDRERAELRERILNAARELFAEFGYEGVSMRKIAERIEYSPTAIYLHFADKETLFRELCTQDFLLLSTEFAALARVADPMERLFGIGEAYVRFGVTHPFHYRLMFMTPPPVAKCGGAPYDEERKGNPETDAYAMLRWTVEKAIAGGAFRAEYNDPELVAQTLWAAVHGVTSMQISLGGNPWLPWCPIEQRTRAALDAVMNGLGRRKE